MKEKNQVVMNDFHDFNGVFHLNYYLNISNKYEDDTLVINVEPKKINSKDNEEQMPIIIITDYNYNFFDFVCREPNSTDALFEFFNISETKMSENNNNFETIKSNPNFKVQEDISSSGLGVLKIYEYFMQKDLIDKANWSLFLHLTGLKENDKKVADNNQFIEFNEIVPYHECFKSNEKNESEIDYKYLDGNRFFTEKMKSKEKDFSISIYDCSNTKELLVSFITHFFRYNEQKEIKKCEHCGKWFIPDRKGTMYCNRTNNTAFV